VTDKLKPYLIATGKRTVILTILFLLQN